MFGDESLLLGLPEKCRVDDLHTLLMENTALIADFCGAQAIRVIENFHREELEKTITSDRGVMFSKEGARIWNAEGTKWVNPRDVVLSLYLAIHALDLGQGRDPGCVLGWKRALELASLDHMTFTIQAYAMYPMFEWRDVKFSPNDQGIVVDWIRKGRNMIER